MNAPIPPRVHAAWYVLCQSHELRRVPLVRELYSQPIVLWRRSDGTPAAVLDRCPHRNVPLSLGEVAGDQLRCGYHGWEFSAAGRCTSVPSFLGEPDSPARCVPSYPCIEQQGFIWVWGDPSQEPVGEPFRFPKADDPNYVTVRHEVRAAASVHAVAENALDVPHTAYLHGGLFRSASVRNRITARVERHDDKVVCEYIGEPRPTGLAARILSPSGGVVTHFDRFFLPSVVQVEYKIGDENHILLNGALCPVSDYDTRLFSVTSVRSRIPGFLLRPLVQPIALYIFGQDAKVLEAQTRTLERFGEEHFVSTEIDLLGPHILRLLRRAAKGEPVREGREPTVREVELDV